MECNVYRKSHYLEYNSCLIGTSDFESSQNCASLKASAIWEFSKSRVPVIHELYEKVVWFFIYSTFNKLRRFHGNLIGTPTEYNLGLIVLLSTNQNWVILLSVLRGLKSYAWFQFLNYNLIICQTMAFLSFIFLQCDWLV